MFVLVLNTSGNFYTSLMNKYLCGHNLRHCQINAYEFYGVRNQSFMYIV